MIDVCNLEYILHDILSVPTDDILSIHTGENTQLITIEARRYTYTEPLFSFTAPALDSNDMSALEVIRSKASESVINREFNQLAFRDSLCQYQVNYLKLAYFFANEHYLDSPLKLDEHQRVTSACVKTQLGSYLDFPVVDILKTLFYNRLLIEHRSRKTLYLTSDLDFIDLWKYLGIPKTVYRLLRHVVHGNFQIFYRELVSVCASKYRAKDNLILPRDLFDIEQHEKLEIIKIAFIHNSSQSTYDMANDLSMPSFVEFIQSLENEILLGIHPSYNTRYNHESMTIQVDEFVRQFGTIPSYSRFHYLNCSYPRDIVCLEKTGIRYDSSLYFSDSLRFRCGISSPFKMWSLELNRPIDVEIIPLSIMDVTLTSTLRLSHEEAQKLCEEKILKSLLFGSTCNLLFHNNMMYPSYFKGNYIAQLKKDIIPVIMKILHHVDQ